ncbi:MAG: M23 family metallopeptidase [Bacteroidales bacterium]
MSNKVFYKEGRIHQALRILLIGLIAGGSCFGLIFYFFGSPQERRVIEQQKLLLQQYELLEKRMDEALAVLDDIRERDDHLYRVMLQSEPISSHTRQASFENIKRYEELFSLPDAELVVSTTRKMDLLARQLYIQSNSFDEILTLGKTHEEKLRRIPAIQPVSNKDLRRTASGYGWRIDPIYKTRKLHEGMDFSAPIGTSVFATGDGVVLKSGWQQGYGYTVEIDHGFGYKTVYAHLNKIKSRQGAKVSRGDLIGEVGNTGKSTGPHLHYEVRLKGKPMNPMNYYFMDLTPEEYDAMTQIASNQGQVMD